MFDYTQKEITVKTQEELDLIPNDFKGRIYIEGGTPFNPIIIKARTNAVLWENSSAELWENSSAELWENSSAVLRGNSSAVLRGNSSAELWGNSSAVLWENSSAELWENSSAELWENSRAVLRGNSSAVLRGNSSAVLRGNSSAELWENSSAVGGGNAQIVSLSDCCKIKISGNARIVYMPKNIHEFMDFYGIKHTKTTATFCKALHKDDDGVYFSDHDNAFFYELGRSYKEACDKNEAEPCGKGLHIAHLDWALDYGKDWSDLAIVEVKTKIADIVLPKNSDGKVRTSELKVVREVPLEECGIMGEIIARRKRK